VLLLTSSDKMSGESLASRTGVYISRTPSYRTEVPVSEALQSWTQQRQDVADRKLRSPVLLGGHRLRLAAERCNWLQYEVNSLDDRLRNAPWFVDQRHMVQLERHKSRLTDELYRERVNAWKDLRDLLLEPIQDASIERLRAAWVGQVFDLAKGDDGHGGYI
jgi:hypothetical protein